MSSAYPMSHPRSLIGMYFALILLPAILSVYIIDTCFSSANDAHFAILIERTSECEWTTFQIPIPVHIVPSTMFALIADMQPPLLYVIRLLHCTRRWIRTTDFQVNTSTLWPLSYPGKRSAGGSSCFCCYIHIGKT